MVKKAEAAVVGVAELEDESSTWLHEAEPSDAERSQRDYQHWLEEKKRKGKEIRWQAQAMFKAMDLWPIQAETEEKWFEICEQASSEYHSGRFLLEQLGAERYLDPKLMATLWQLRNGLVEDFGMQNAAEEMLIDLMMLGYYNTLRVQGWVGNLASQIERQFFDEYGLDVWVEERRGKREARQLLVGNQLERLREQLLPLLDRTDRMFIRNLRALQDLRRRPAPTVNIGAAGQVNVASQQINKGG